MRRQGLVCDVPGLIRLAADIGTYEVLVLLRDLQAALEASDEVVMPIQCEYFAMEGLTQMIQVIRRVIERGRGNLEFGGILLTMYDATLELTAEVDREVRDFFGEVVFENVIPRDVAVSEAPSHGLPAMYHDKNSRGSKAYMALAGEIIRKVEQQHAPLTGDAVAT